MPPQPGGAPAASGTPASSAQIHFRRIRHHGLASAAVAWLSLRRRLGWIGARHEAVAHHCCGRLRGRINPGYRCTGSTGAAIHATGALSAARASTTGCALRAGGYAGDGIICARGDSSSVGRGGVSPWSRVRVPPVAALLQCYNSHIMKTSRPRPSNLGVLSARLDGRSRKAEAVGSNPTTQTISRSRLSSLGY